MAAAAAAAVDKPQLSAFDNRFLVAADTAAAEALNMIQVPFDKLVAVAEVPADKQNSLDKQAAAAAVAYYCTTLPVCCTTAAEAGAVADSSSSDSSTPRAPGSCTAALSNFSDSHFLPCTAAIVRSRTLPLRDCTTAN